MLTYLIIGTPARNADCLYFVYSTYGREITRSSAIANNTVFISSVSSCLVVADQTRNE